MAPQDVRPRFTALANSLGGVCRWGGARNVTYVESFEIAREGVRLVGEPTLGSKGSCMGVEIFAALRHRAMGVLTRFAREGALDRFGKRLGVTREYHTGDPAFDQAVFIDSAARDSALARFLASPDVRRALLDVLSVHPVDVTFALPPAAGEPGVDCVRLSVPIKYFYDLPGLERLFSALIELVRACDQAGSALGTYRGGDPGQGVDDTPLPSRRGRYVLALALVLVPVIVAIALPAGRAFGWGAAFWGYVAGAVLWLAYGVIFALLFRGRSSSLGTVAWAWASALAVIVSAGPAAEKLNALLDSGRPSTHVGTAQFHIPQKGSGYVELHATWLPGSPSARAPENVWVLGSEGVVPVTIVTRPGAFGSPWVVSAHR